VVKRLLVCIWLVAATVSFDAASPIRYRLTFPEPQHRWMQVDASFTELSADTLELRMSRSSPGRYSLHDFAKNVYDVHPSPPTARAAHHKTGPLLAGTSPVTAARSQ
jgi:hypothetical protein